MSYYVTNENSFLDIKNAHLRVTGNVHTDVLKVGSIGFQPAGSNISGTVNFTNVTTGVTTTSNLNVGGTLNLGTIELSASTHTLDHITARGNVTSTTVQFNDATTGLVTTSNVEVGGELTVSGNATVSSNLVVSGNVEVSADTQVQEYPPRALRQYTTHVEGHGVFTVRASDEYNQTGDNDRAWKLFTKIADNSNYWTPDSVGYDASNGNATSASPSTNGTTGHWVQLELPYKIKLHSVKIAAGISTRQAKDATVFGSNDGGNTWTSVGGWTDNNVSDYSLVTFSMNNVGYYNLYRLVVTKNGGNAALTLSELQFFGTPGPTTLDKGSLSLGRSLDVPRVSRYDVDTETPRPEKLVLDLDTTVNSTPTDISGKGNHGNFEGAAEYSEADKAFTGFPNPGGIAINYIKGNLSGVSGAYAHTQSYWINGADTTPRCPFTVGIETGNYSYLNIWLTTSKWVLNADGAANGEWAETIYDNRWYHVVLTYDGGISTSSYKLYINGEYKTPTTAISITTSLALPSNPEYRIGRNDGTQWYNGMVSNPKVYSVVLEPSEIRKLYNLGRTGRSMVISDTAVGIGKAPEAQLDVRGNMTVRGDVDIPSGRFTIHRFMGSGTGTFGGSGNITLPFELDYGPNNPAVGWEIRLSFGASGTNYGMCSISGCYDNEDTLTGVSEAFSLQLRTTETNWTDHGSECFLSRRETVAPAYQAIIRIVNPLAENIPPPSAGLPRWHFSYECTGCYASTGATTIRGGGYFLFGAADRRIKHLILNSATGSISGHYNFVAIS